tara:strand:- start:84 stop:368 length:285 start_codon:yes stop_codon:yes gene_type:complete
MADYKSSSPYSKTKMVGDYLDLMTHRSVAYDRTDETYIVESKYDMRPDLLAYDRFGSSRYWWLFAMRNKDIIIDPIQDFKAGLTIRIPKLENIR